VIARARHVHDDRLLDSYYAERRGERLDPPIAEHLGECDACNARYADLARFMNTLREDADAEIEKLFPLEFLHRQQQQIARRLEHVGHAARVISFPVRFVDRHIRLSARRVTTRWVAAAAAAGLFVGVAASMFFDAESHALRNARRYSARQVSSPTRPARLTPIAADLDRPASPLAIDVDNEFLSDLEVALEFPRTSELQPFDALTPHVREIRDVR
jgi:hypothetical protein